MTPKQTRKLICVDFDGVLHSYTSGWRGVATIPDKPVPGAMAWLVDIIDFCDIAIYSSRSSSWRGRWAMKRWLHDYMSRYMWARLPSIPDARNSRAWSYVVSRSRRIVYWRIRWPKTMPTAWMTLDDRAVRFCGVFPSDREIMQFRPWNIRFGDGNGITP